MGFETVLLQTEKGNTYMSPMVYVSYAVIGAWFFMVLRAVRAFIKEAH